MLQNRELRRFLLLFVTLTFLFAVLGFFFFHEAVLLFLLSSAVYGGCFFVFTQKRYRNLARISAQIDLVLHRFERFALDDFDEGELSILHNNIQKMTLRLLEQHDALQKEKQYLADSLADIAHQLRTPLTSANLTLSFLAKNPSEEKRQAFVAETQALLLRMDWLITSLLKISRLDAGVAKFQNNTFFVTDLVHTAFRPLSIPMELRNITCQMSLPKDAVLCGDSDWLAEAIQNILKNCMESVGENGHIEISCIQNNLFLELAIHDDGAGFEKKDLPHLFQRFYRGNTEHATGYGIGLALSKMIILQQGGSILAKNHPQGGALFLIRFPQT